MHTQIAPTQTPTHQVPLGPRVDTIHNLEDEVAHCNRNLELIRREAETTESLEGEAQAAVVTLDLVRVATAFKKLPFQVGRTIRNAELMCGVLMYTHTHTQMNE